MNSNFSEDEILTMLNDIEISENELSSENLNEIEKKKLKKNILNNVKFKKPKVKKSIIAASVAALMLMSVSLFKQNAFNGIYSKLAATNEEKPDTTTVIPGLGQVTLSHGSGLLLKDSIKSNDVILNTLYMDNTKVIASITASSNNDTKYLTAKYSLKDASGNTYNLEGIRLLTNSGNLSTFEIEYNGNVKPSSNYTLDVINDTATFTFSNSSLKTLKKSKPLYTSTSGNMTLNITSISKKNNILRIDYYFTNKLRYDGNASTLLNPLTFKNDFTENKAQTDMMLKNIKETQANNYIFLEDEYGNIEYGHNTPSTFNNESFFDLKKLKGHNIKLMLPSLLYFTGNDIDKNDFNITLKVPKLGEQSVNETYDYNGYEFEILGIKRLSNKSVQLTCKTIDNFNDPKLKNLAVVPFSLNSDSDGKIDSDVYSINLFSHNTIGDSLNINGLHISYLYEGPFEINLDLNSLNH